MGGAKAHYDCIKAFSETDFTEDLKAIDVPVLILHGDDDQVVPIADSALLSAKLVKKGTLKVYPGFPTGWRRRTPMSYDRDLLAFIKGEPIAAKAIVAVAGYEAPIAAPRPPPGMWLQSAHRRLTPSFCTKQKETMQ